MDFGRIYFGSDENDELINFPNVNYVDYYVYYNPKRTRKNKR